MKKFIIVGCIIISILTLMLPLKSWFQEEPRIESLKPLLAQKPLKHLGIIMDGNRRWAKKQGLKPWIGHKEGVNPIKETLSFCQEHGIKELTLYVLSLDNLKRPQEELSYLFDVLAQEIASKEFEGLVKRGIRVRFIGDRTKFPAQLVPLIEDIEAQSAANQHVNLNLLFCYGGTYEIEAAAAACGGDPEKFQASLWSRDIPPLDLIIRTGGCKRLSNYLPIQSTYAELYFSDRLWPELTKKDLHEAVRFFVEAKRNFGT